MADHPVDFGLFLVAGVCEYIIEQLKLLAETGMSIIHFVGDYVTCVRDIGHALTIWDIDAILNSVETRWAGAELWIRGLPRRAPRRHPRPR